MTGSLLFTFEPADRFATQFTKFLVLGLITGVNVPEYNIVKPWKLANDKYAGTVVISSPDALPLLNAVTSNSQYPIESSITVAETTLESSVSAITRDE